RERDDCACGSSADALLANGQIWKAKKCASGIDGTGLFAECGDRFGRWRLELRMCMHLAQASTQQLLSAVPFSTVNERTGTAARDRYPDHGDAPQGCAAMIALW